VAALTVANHRIVAGTRGKGIFIADDSDGESWSLVGDRVLSELRCLEYDGTFLYAGTEDGVFRID
jgi:hypothetical protein